MTEDLKYFLIDLDLAVDTVKENFEGKYRKFKHENEIIDKLMHMRFIKKLDRVYAEECSIFSQRLIDKVYGKRTSVLA